MDGVRKFTSEEQTHARTQKQKQKNFQALSKSPKAIYNKNSTITTATTKTTKITSTTTIKKTPAIEALGWRQNFSFDTIIHNQHTCWLLLLLLLLLHLRHKKRDTCVHTCITPKQIESRMVRF